MKRTLPRSRYCCNRKCNCWCRRCIFPNSYKVPTRIRQCRSRSLSRGSQAGTRTYMMPCRSRNVLRSCRDYYRTRSHPLRKSCRCSQPGIGTRMYWCRRCMWHCSCTGYIDTHRCQCHSDHQKNLAGRNNCSCPRCWRRCRYCTASYHASRTRSHRCHNTDLQIKFHIIEFSQETRNKCF